jgi:hypothetical protein
LYVGFARRRLTTAPSGLPSHIGHPRLEILAVPKLQRLTVMFPLKTYGRPGSHISWLASELTAFDLTPISSVTSLERITLFVVLAPAQVFDEQELRALERMSETLASQERFPVLKSVEITIGFYEEGSLQIDGIVRQEVRAKPHDPWGIEARRGFGEAIQAIVQRGLDSFEVKWELHETSPWDWY